MDLGVLMAQEHRLLLMASWALVSLPIFIALSVLLWQYPSTALFVFWWLKPAFDRLPLYILSKALFGETPSLKQAVRHWPRLLKGQLLASLTWRRLSLSRSFLMPVSQLEGLDGQARQKRLGVLQQHNAGAARWLTTLGVHLESACGSAAWRCSICSSPSRLNWIGTGNGWPWQPARRGCGWNT